MTDWNLEIAARTVYGEARGEGARGMIAVAHVILNRAEADKWFSGETIAGCCMMPYQFSCWNNKDPNFMKLVNLSEVNEELEDCRGYIIDAMSGTEPDPTDGATHYHATSIPAPNWTAGATKICQIGRHIFYKNVK